MKRRSVLRSLLAVPSVAALPSEVFAQEVRPAPSETPKTATNDTEAAGDPIVKTFTKAQFAALRKLGEILTPGSHDTPGALEASAAEFLDFLIGVSPADRMTLYRSGFDRLNADAHQRYSKSFAEITAEQAPGLFSLHCANPGRIAGRRMRLRSFYFSREERSVGRYRELARVRRQSGDAARTARRRSGSILVSH